MALFDRLRNLVRPKPGESTGLQNPQTGPRSLGGLVSASSDVSGFTAPEPGTFALYRKMSGHPTLALIEAIATGPIRTNIVGWQSRPDADEDWVESVKAVFEPQWARLVRDTLKALRYGFHPGEVVWDRYTLNRKTVRGGKGKPAKKVYRLTWGAGDSVAPRRVKPLMVDNTEPLVDANGNLRGLRNKAQRGDPVDLLGAKVFWYTYDGEGGNPFGRSRHENVRQHWAQANTVLDRLGAYHKKIAGVVTQLHYPDGTSKNESGADVPNYQIAQQILREVSAGKSVAFLNKFASMLSGDDGRATPSIMEKALAAAGKSDWVLSFLEAGGVDFAPGFLETMAYYDKCFCRGWLRPERSALEADKSGSRADSQSHTDTGMADSSLVALDIANAIREQLIDPYLVVNFGEEARGAVWPEPSPMEDNTSDTLKAIVEAGLANPQLAEPVARKIDWDAILDDQEIPVVEEERGPVGDNLIPLAEQAAATMGDGQGQQQDNADGKAA